MLKTKKKTQNSHQEMRACNRGKNHNDNTFFITNPGSQKKLAKHCFNYWNKRPVNPEFYLQWKHSSRRKKNQSIFRGPGGPVVKTSPSNAGSMDSIPGQRTKILYASWGKKQKCKREATL